ncbi:P-loop NTPase fold protein [Idiomarina abyssalis]|uniref:P-loop NTPase fold protein n=1 Tax=Idiomarina abyssalis TaxID=86102 RepID=UPI001CD5EAC5|nr:P-loop NTPase fold protein [Idiomarina abyssalis]
MISKLNFLVEKPAKEDEYESGSHQRIAESILETLRYNDEVNVIGIEGELGSGKSTVINIIERECKKDE